MAWCIKSLNNLNWKAVSIEYIAKNLPTIPNIVITSSLSINGMEINIMIANAAKLETADHLLPKDRVVQGQKKFF